MPLADDGAEHVDRRRIERNWKGLGVAAPQPTGESMQYVIHAKSCREQRKPVRIRNGPHDQALDEDAKQRHADDRQGEGEVIVESELLEQDQRHESADHREVALGEIDGAGIAKDNDHRNGSQCIEATGREPAHNLLAKHLASSMSLRLSTATGWTQPAP